MGTIRVLDYEIEHRPGKTPLEWLLVSNTDSMTATGQAQSATWMRVRDLMPPKEGTFAVPLDSDHVKVQQEVWNAIRPQYEAKRDMQNVTIDGTPLAAWGGATAKQIVALNQIGVLSVEQLADLSEAVLQSPIIPHLRELRSQAIQWRQGRPAAELNARLEELERKNAALEAALNDQGEEGEEPRRRPGRPRKEAA